MGCTEANLLIFILYKCLAPSNRCTKGDLAEVSCAMIVQINSPGSSVCVRGLCVLVGIELGGFGNNCNHMCFHFSVQHVGITPFRLQLHSVTIAPRGWRDCLLRHTCQGCPRLHRSLATLVTATKVQGWLLRADEGFGPRPIARMAGNHGGHGVPG